MKYALVFLLLIISCSGKVAKIEQKFRQKTLCPPTYSVQTSVWLFDNGLSVSIEWHDFDTYVELYDAQMASVTQFNNAMSYLKKQADCLSEKGFKVSQKTYAQEPLNIPSNVTTPR